MPSINLYLHIHQPFRFRKYTAFDIGNNSDYWNDKNLSSKNNNERIFKKVAKKSYHPTFDLLEKNLKKFPKFKFSLSITGVWLDQAEKWDPSLIEQLKRIVNTGRVEIVAETYYHSLTFFHNRQEFELQVSKHRAKIKQIFGIEPKVFRNTELAYNDELAKWAEDFGFAGILAEGWDKILGWRSPNNVYQPAGCRKIKLLLKNYRLSDDIAFRFSDRGWKEWPLDVKKYQSWLTTSTANGPLINLFMDFETFGEHQWESSGIFDFLNGLIASWLKNPLNDFVTVFDATKIKPVDKISMKKTVTWADSERDLTAWDGNSMQKRAATELYALYPKVLNTNDADLLEDFRRLTTSDHFYYMCTKYWNDGDVHAYFSAYDSPYDASLYFTNIIRDLEFRCSNRKAPASSHPQI